MNNQQESDDRSTPLIPSNVHRPSNRLPALNDPPTAPEVLPGSVSRDDMDAGVDEEIVSRTSVNKVVVFPDHSSSHDTDTSTIRTEPVTRRPSTKETKEAADATAEAVVTPSPRNSIVMKGLTTDELEQKVKTMTHAAGMYFSFVCSKYHHSDFTKEETKAEEGKRAPAEPDAEKRARLETEFVLQKKLLRTFRAVASGDIAFPMLDDDVVRYAMNHKAFNGAYYTYLESKGDRIKQNAQDKLTAQERGKKEVTPSLKEFAASSTGAEEGAGEGEQDGSSTAEVVADDDEGIQGLLRPASQSAVA